MIGFAFAIAIIAMFYWPGFGKWIAVVGAVAYIATARTYFWILDREKRTQSNNQYPSQSVRSVREDGED